MGKKKVVRNHTKWGLKSNFQLWEKVMISKSEAKVSDPLVLQRHVCLSPWRHGSLWSVITKEAPALVCPQCCGATSATRQAVLELDKVRMVFSIANLKVKWGMNGILSILWYPYKSRDRWDSGNIRAETPPSIPAPPAVPSLRIFRPRNRDPVAAAPR